MDEMIENLRSYKNELQRPLSPGQKLVNRDLQVLWHPCSQMKDHESYPLLPIRRGYGVWLEDYQGKRYLDAISSWWVNLFGHCHPQINQRVTEQLSRLDHLILAGFTHEGIVELSEKLLELAPIGLGKCFYADSGSAAIEIALKMSLHFWHNQGHLRKTKFIKLGNSYHGETVGAMSLSDNPMYTAPYQPLLFQTLTAPSPDCFYREAGESWESYSNRKFVELENLLAANADEVCGVIVEPLVQCAGKMRMYHPIYLKKLRLACDKYNVHLIADEIAVGFGRTGSLFACEQANITPDFLCLAKGLTGGYLPLSVVLTTDEIYAAFYDDYHTAKAFLHSHSYTGNPLAVSAALATLELLTPKVINNNLGLAKNFQLSCQIFEGHPHIAEVRQAGMIIAIELVKDRRSKSPFPSEARIGKKIAQAALARGILLRPLDNVIYFMTPYVITPAQIEFLLENTLASINQVVAELHC